MPRLISALGRCSTCLRKRCLDERRALKPHPLLVTSHRQTAAMHLEGHSTATSAGHHGPLAWKSEDYREQSPTTGLNYIEGGDTERPVAIAMASSPPPFMKKRAVKRSSHVANEGGSSTASPLMKRTSLCALPVDASPAGTCTAKAHISQPPPPPAVVVYPVVPSTPKEKVLHTDGAIDGKIPCTVTITFTGLFDENLFEIAETEYVSHRIDCTHGQLAGRCSLPAKIQALISNTSPEKEEQEKEGFQRSSPVRSCSAGTVGMKSRCHRPFHPASKQALSPNTEASRDKGSDAHLAVPSPTEDSRIRSNSDPPPTPIRHLKPAARQRSKSPGLRSRCNAISEADVCNVRSPTGSPGPFCPVSPPAASPTHVIHRQSSNDGAPYCQIPVQTASAQSSPIAPSPQDPKCMRFPASSKTPAAAASDDDAPYCEIPVQTASAQSSPIAPSPREPKCMRFPASPKTPAAAAARARKARSESELWAQKHGYITLVEAHVGLSPTRRDADFFVTGEAAAPPEPPPRSHHQKDAQSNPAAAKHNRVLLARRHANQGLLLGLAEMHMDDDARTSPEPLTGEGDTGADNVFTSSP